MEFRLCFFFQLLEDTDQKYTFNDIKVVINIKRNNTMLIN